jgi:hypothetical protein
MSLTVKQVYQYDALSPNLEFAYNFKIMSPSHIKVIKRLADLTSVVLDLNTDYTLTGVKTNSGGLVTLDTALAVDELLFIFLDTIPSRQAQFSSSPRVVPSALDNELDRIYAQIRQLTSLVKNTIKIKEGFEESEFDVELPEEILDPANAEKYIRINDAGNGLTFGLTEAEIEAVAAAAGAAAGAVAGASNVPDPVAGEEKNFLEVDDPTLDPVWQSAQFTGFSARFGNAFFDVNGIREAINAIFNFAYLLPGATLTTNISTALRERGDTVTAQTLSTNVTRNSDPILDVGFYEDSIAPGNIIGSLQTGDPNSGVRTQAWTGSFDSNKTFWVQVRDDGASNSGTPQNRNVSLNFNFVYPYYFGVGVPGLTPAQVASLTKQIINPQSSANRVFNFAVGDVFYFAYPASISALTSILDENGFENLSNFTQRNEDITGLDGTPQPYRIYEFNNPAGISGTTNYTFIR